MDTMTEGVDLTDTTCPSGHAYTACAVGTYKTQSGNALCTACPYGSNSSIASPSIAAGICQSGYNCTTCVDMPSNDLKQYSTDIGTWIYGDSPTYQNGGDNVGHCISDKMCAVCCESYKAECNCSVGKTEVLYRCVSCLPGTFKNVTGGGPCVQCDVGKYSTECTLSHCVCDAGYQPGNGSLLGFTTCTACDPSFYKDFEGNTACVQCDIGKYSTESVMSPATVHRPLKLCSCMLNSGMRRRNRLLVTDLSW
jgi:hypothetical protein